MFVRRFKNHCKFIGKGMKIIGLTGGSGAGKGEVCKAFLSLGIESVDTDKISRDVTKKGSRVPKTEVITTPGKILSMVKYVIRAIIRPKINTTPKIT